MQCNNWELGPYTLVLKALNESSHPTVTTSSQSEARFSWQRVPTDGRGVYLIKISGTNTFKDQSFIKAMSSFRNGKSWTKPLFPFPTRTGSLILDDISTGSRNDSWHVFHCGTWLRNLSLDLSMSAEGKLKAIRCSSNAKISESALVIFLRLLFSKETTIMLKALF